MKSKSIKKTIQYSIVAVVVGVVSYQAFALNVGGEDDRGSTVSIFGRRTDNDDDGSLVRVGGLKVLGGNGEVVGYESKKSRVCEKGRYDARHGRTRSYFRQSNQDEYESCKADEKSTMKQEGEKPQKRRRSSFFERRRDKRSRSDEESEGRRSKKMRSDEESEGRRSKRMRSEEANIE